VILCVGITLLPKDVGDFHAALGEYVWNEGRAVGVFNDGVSKVKAGSMTEEQWAERIEKDALPCWKAMAAAMRGLPNLPRRARKEAEKLAAYAEASEEWMGLHAQALRTNDKDLMAKAAVKRARTAGMLKDGR
jgi:hypothetical protein